MSEVTAEQVIEAARKRWPEAIGIHLEDTKMADWEIHSPIDYATDCWIRVIYPLARRASGDLVRARSLPDLLAKIQEQKDV